MPLSKPDRRPHHADLESEDFACDDLEILRIRGREAISQLYRYDVVVIGKRRLAEARPLDPNDMIGAAVRLHLRDESEAAVRRIHGIVARVERRITGAYATYELEIVPRAWQLSLVSTQEVFLDMSVPEIIRTKLERFGLVDYVVFRTMTTYPKRDLVVQYRETDLAFVSRLAEHLGISFYFEEEGKTERMVFTDHRGGFASLGEQDVSFAPRDEGRGVHDLAVAGRVVPGMVAVQDFNYRNPKLELQSVEPVVPGAPGGIVEYGSHHKSGEEGAELAKVRAQELLATRRVYGGRGFAGSFSAGVRCAIEDHEPDGRLALLVTEVTHHFERRVDDASDGEAGYENTFSAVPDDTTYRPPRITPRPRIGGFVTGVIQSGPNAAIGVQAKIDDQGRYTVEFHYDTMPNPQRSSHAVRMAQPFAGPQQGMHFPLRPGTEVIVAFHDGDPDRPVIVGAMPNPVTPSHVTASDSHMHRIRSFDGLVVEFGKSNRS
jgi:type VI secretion system secreted protein VgrG